MEALEYAARIVGRMEYIAVTCLDRLDLSNKVCFSYCELDLAGVPNRTVQNFKEQALLTEAVGRVNPFYGSVYSEKDLLDYISKSTFTPIGILSNSPTFEGKTFLPNFSL